MALNPGGHWIVWRYGLHRSAADAGDWNSHGPGRGPRESGPDGLGRSVKARDRRAASGRASGHWRRTAYRHATLWRFHLGPVRSGRSSRLANDLGIFRCDDSGPPRSIHFTDESAEDGVAKKEQQVFVFEKRKAEAARCLNRVTSHAER